MEDFLKFAGITKTYGSTAAVNNVSFSIQRGESFSLPGFSGSGKTPLLRPLALLIIPQISKKQEKQEKS